MRRTLFTHSQRVVGPLLVVAASIVAMAMPAGAGVAPISVSPTTLTGGGIITSTGSCGGNGVQVSIYAGWTNEFDVPTSPAVSVSNATMIDGGWTALNTVSPGTPAGPYTLRAVCTGGDGSYAFQNVEITVLAAILPTTTTLPGVPTTMSVAPTTATATATPPTATAPRAVTATPTYTG